MEYEYGGEFVINNGIDLEKAWDKIMKKNSNKVEKKLNKSLVK